MIDGSLTQFGLKIHPQEFSTLDGTQGAIEFRKDVRVQMVASLIKAAHLTLFEMLGYQYALRATGEFVGHQILGQFFQSNKGKSKAVIARNALVYFREFATMVRPLIQCGFEAQGTIVDKTLFFCMGGSGAVWGMVVLVKTGKMIHGILIPSFDTPEEAPTFFDFLKSENENIHIAACRFNGELDRWEVGKQTQPMVWPKKGVLYPSTSEAEIE